MDVLEGCQRLMSEDRISDLPNDVLGNILSLLTLKQAVATSILSRRWRSLWKHHLLSLNFCCEHGKLRDDGTFIQMVNQVIKAYESPALLEFGLYCCYHCQSFTDYIDGCIAFAISRGVSRLHLDTGHGGVGYSMPPNLFNETDDMEPYLKRLGWISSNLTSSLVRHSPFKTIKELQLKFVNFSDEALDAILSRCSFLEHLCLCGIGELINARPAMPLPRLRCLEMYSMMDLENLELHAPGLVSFKYHGPKINIHIIDALGLVDVSIVSFMRPRDYKYTNYLGRPYPDADKFAFGQFAVYLSQLKYLMMDAYSFVGKEAFPVFSSLKQLTIYTTTSEHFGPCYHAVTSFLKASPLLQRLKIHLPLLDRPTFKENRKLKLTPISLHKNLKELWISGFLGKHADVILVKYIVNHAPALEDVGITALGATWLGGHLEYSENILPNANECYSRLREILPSGAQLTIYV